MQYNNNSNNVIPINNQSMDLNNIENEKEINNNANNSLFENKTIVNKNINYDKNIENNIEDLYLNKSVPNFNKNLLNNSRNNNNKQIVKDIILINQTITENSKIPLEEFKNDNIVERLIKCPQNKYISLNCSEANKLALVLIMVTSIIEIPPHNEKN